MPSQNTQSQAPQPKADTHGTHPASRSTVSTSKLRMGIATTSQLPSSSGVQRGCRTEPIRPKPSHPAPSTVFPDDSISVRGIEAPPSKQTGANVGSSNVKRPQNGSTKPSAPQPGASNRQVPQALPQTGEPFFGVMWPTWYQFNEPLLNGSGTPPAPNSSPTSRQAPRAPPRTEEPVFGMMWPWPYWCQSNEPLFNGGNRPSAPAPDISNRQAPQTLLDPMADDFGMNGLDWYQQYYSLEEPLDDDFGMKWLDNYLPSEPLPYDTKPKPFVSQGPKYSYHTRQGNSQGAPTSSRFVPAGTKKRVAPSRSATLTATSNKPFSRSTTQENSKRAPVPQRPALRATNSKAPTYISKSSVPVKARSTTAPFAKKTASQQQHKAPQGVPSNAVSASQAGASTGLPTQNRDLSHWH